MFTLSPQRELEMGRTVQRSCEDKNTSRSTSISSGIVGRQRSTYNASAR